ncbi:hypothetical protein BD410DRAFT_784197 [Rickenella mellea]|uniref:Uncharacterized protein n=1 Tax=Rickenella mellea TaxID=50990 RepID=A0A4Y7QEP8_9AGAM|nr:hypothetical protein BD410DRAFT_784197 [Rickenella mellea]
MGFGTCKRTYQQLMKLYESFCIKQSVHGVKKKPPITGPSKAKLRNIMGVSTTSCQKKCAIRQ